MTRRELLKKTAVAVVGMPLMGKLALARKPSIGDFRREVDREVDKSFMAGMAPHGPWLVHTCREKDGFFVARFVTQPRLVGYVWSFKFLPAESYPELSEMVRRAIVGMDDWWHERHLENETEIRKNLTGGNWPGADKAWVITFDRPRSISGDKRTIRGGNYWPLTVVGDGSCLSS